MVLILLPILTAALFRKVFLKEMFSGFQCFQVYSEEEQKFF